MVIFIVMSGMWDLMTRYVEERMEDLKSMEERWGLPFQVLESRLDILQDECNNFRKSQVHWHQSATA